MSLPDAQSRLLFSPSRTILLHGGRVFDPWTLAWGQPSAEATPSDCSELSPRDAIRTLAERNLLRRVPVGVIGPKRASAEHLSAAEQLGAALTRAGLQVLTGGRTGVMEAASKGAFDAGGMPIGITPDDEWTSANRYVAIPLATGLGPARNAVIARACEVLIAIGGEYGTLSEMALGMHFNRLVLTLLDAPEVPGVQRCGSVDEALDRAARWLLRLDRAERS